MGNWHRTYICTDCGHEIEEEAASAWRECPKCDARMYDANTRTHKVIDVPLKGSKEYYEERWFRRNEKEWHNDIKSRTLDKSGNPIRINSKGERIW